MDAGVGKPLLPCAESGSGVALGEASGEDMTTLSRRPGADDFWSR